MNSAELLTDAFGRIHDVVHAALDGLTGDELVHRSGDQTNSIAWLIWHLTRIQDDHVADVAGTEQVYPSQGWAERFALPLKDSDTGYGHNDSQVDAVHITDPELLAGYFDAVHAATLAFLANLTDADLDRVVDTRWDPPVTLGVRLISVISDDLQHAGQAAFLKGLRRPF